MHADNFITRIINAFDDVDSNYVERIPYNFTAMMQATRNFEFYTVGNVDYAQRLAFAERRNLRIGPYLGWRWLTLGYTFDVTQFGKKVQNQGANVAMAFYTSKFGVDLLYRRTGSNFYFRDIEGLGNESTAFEGTDAGDYIHTNVTGIKLYWVFNSRRFSNPAVFSQSTIQRRSAGSFLLGLNVSFHDVRFNYHALPQQLFLSEADNENIFHSLERVKYTVVGAQIGYAHNFVLGRGWCLNLSLLPAVSYQLASTKTAILTNNSDVVDDQQGEYDESMETAQPNETSNSKLDDIFRQRSSVGIDFTTRCGIIYNSGRWFTGLTAIAYNYNYYRHQIRFNNTFGNLNLFVGFYFQKRKPKGSLQTTTTTITPEPTRPEIPVVEY